MRWDEKLDSIIVDILYKKKAVEWGKLHREINLCYKKISKDAYQRHMKRLRSKGKIERNDNQNRGCLVSYFLSEKTKKQKSLEIIGTDAEQDKLRILYILILMFTQRSYYEFENEWQFDMFLSSLHLSRDRLFTVSDSGNQLVELNDELVQLKIYRSNNGEIDIVRKKYIRSPSRKTNSIAYHCGVKGITEKMIFTSKYRPAFWHVGFTSSEVKRSFEMMRKEGMLQAAYLHNGEIIYKISDNKLDALLYDCYVLYRFFHYHIVEYIWKYVRRPNQEEINWLETFEGKHRVDRIRNEAYLYRKQLMSKDKNWKTKLAADNRDYPIDLSDLACKLKEKHTQTIKNYRFIIDDLINLICLTLKK